MTFDEARLMANVDARARRLFDNGYRARWKGTNVLEVRSPQGAAYRLDTLYGTCDCPFFRGHQGRHPCKHLLGWKRLLARQRACRRFVAFALLRAWIDLDDGAPRTGTDENDGALRAGADANDASPRVREAVSRTPAPQKESVHADA